MNRWIPVLGLVTAALATSASAGVIDLTMPGSSFTTADGVVFQQADPQPTGTGVIQPFLRLQNTPTENGINTSLDQPNQPILDDKPGTWTHDLNLADLQAVTLSGHTGQYYEFLLDINQTTPGHYLNLDTIQFYVHSQFTSLSAFDSFFNISGNNNETLGTLPPGGFNALGTGNTSVLLDYSLNSGSGSGDMFMFVPVAELQSLGSGSLYLVNQNGMPNSSNDGFEEWAASVGPNTPGVPDGGTTVMLLGCALAGLGFANRRCKVLVRT